MQGFRSLLTTLVFLVLCGISLAGGVQALRLATAQATMRPGEQFLASQTDRLLRDEVLSEDLPKRPASDQRDLALRLEARLEQGGWPIATGRLWRHEQEQLGKNLFILVRAWLEAIREQYQQATPDEQSRLLTAKLEFLRMLVERGKTLPPQERGRYLEGMFPAVIEAPQRDRPGGQGMWRNVLTKAGTEFAAWWKDLDADEQARWSDFAFAILPHLPPDFLPPGGMGQGIFAGWGNDSRP